MLFNSYIFLFLFLPVTLIVFWALGGTGSRSLAKGWLVAASLFFYSWWNPPYVLLIIGSIAVNYSIGYLLGRWRSEGRHHALGCVLLGVGLAADLASIGYYKYGHFAAENLNAWLGTTLPVVNVFLPLGISFFTFQQMTYLVDAHKGIVRNFSLIDYMLFVTFFPQLIAGPIVHHSDVLPQFARARSYRFHAADFSVGLAILSFGLFKKVVIADSVALYANPVFGAARDGVALSFLEAWGGALAYTLQLYFDFSGYSDMAIGLGRMFRIRLPLNFDSPYQAANISDFWRRWHMTLSQFLRDYLYVPLGGNRKGKSRRYTNLMITMLLGGLWHGAGWTYVWWGGLHGFFLIVHHTWQYVRGLVARPAGIVERTAGRALTFVVVVVGWVFFRAEDFGTATALLRSMWGGNGLALPSAAYRLLGGVSTSAAGWLRFDGPFEHELFSQQGFLIVGALLLVVWFAPNVISLMHRYRPIVRQRRPMFAPNVSWLSWRLSVFGGLATAICLLVSILLMSRISEFLYFQF